MSKRGNSGPGYAEHPEHTVVVRPFQGRVLVEVGGEVIADTRHALQLDEADYPPVFYVPRGDARMDRLDKTSHHSHCPFKGEASYYSVRPHDAPRIDKAVWSYEAPFDEVLAIREHLAFYPNKVTVRVEPDAA